MDVMDVFKAYDDNEWSIIKQSLFEKGVYWIRFVGFFMICHNHTMSLNCYSNNTSFYTLVGNPTYLVLVLSA